MLISFVIYVDDVLIIGVKISTIKQQKPCLAQELEIIDCNTVKYFLDMKIDLQRNAEALKL